jgi:hypothetical protein
LNSQLVKSLGPYASEGKHGMKKDSNIDDEESRLRNLAGLGLAIANVAALGLAEKNPSMSGLKKSAPFSFAASLKAILAPVSQDMVSSLGTSEEFKSKSKFDRAMTYTAFGECMNGANLMAKGYESLLKDFAQEGGGLDGFEDQVCLHHLSEYKKSDSSIIPGYIAQLSNPFTQFPTFTKYSGQVSVTGVHQMATNESSRSHKNSKKHKKRKTDETEHDGDVNRSKKRRKKSHSSDDEGSREREGNGKAERTTRKLKYDSEKTDSDDTVSIEPKRKQGRKSKKHLYDATATKQELKHPLPLHDLAGKQEEDKEKEGGRSLHKVSRKRHSGVKSHNKRYTDASEDQADVLTGKKVPPPGDDVAGKCDDVKDEKRKRRSTTKKNRSADKLTTKKAPPPGDDIAGNLLPDEEEKCRKRAQRERRKRLSHVKILEKHA